MGRRSIRIRTVFQSTPARERATKIMKNWKTTTSGFNPRPPASGRRVKQTKKKGGDRFQSTPARERATTPARRSFTRISGFNPRPPASGRQMDIWRNVVEPRFNPRPPASGRLLHDWELIDARRFQSTPARERATAIACLISWLRCCFNPRPPASGRPRKTDKKEGRRPFQSTPARERATVRQKVKADKKAVSIHARPRAGDRPVRCHCPGRPVSIHARPRAGDLQDRHKKCYGICFNPRPPASGRQRLDRRGY